MNKLLGLILMFTSFGLAAQLNPKDIFVNVKSETSVNIEISSQGPAQPDVVVFPSSYDSLGFSALGGGLWNLHFEPSDAFSGDLHFVIEYFEFSGIPGFFIPNYSTIHCRVEQSKLDSEIDYSIVSSSGSSEIDVLANDNSTDGNLNLERIGYVEGGTANIANNKISFTPNSGVKSGFLRYFNSDSTDNIESSLVYISIEDSELQETRNLQLDRLSQAMLLLNSNAFSVTQSPVHGSLTQNGHTWSYDPDNNYSGVDSILFTSPDGGEIKYLIDVLYKLDDRSFVRDDQYFVVTNGSLQFNVFDNDYLDDFAIVDYSSELTYLGDGVFEYSPPADFTGDQIFYYKIFAGFQFHTGNILIHVDDYAPSDDYMYDFTILNNHDLVIDHEAPVNDYFFSVVNAPEDGTIIILDNNESETLECDIISGDNKIIYTPNTDFSGDDSFNLEFCTTTGICKTLDVHVNILDSNYDECLCLNNCVYKGDYNHDGVVNVQDVLDLALNLGEGGPERTNDFDLFWTGQEGEDWGYEQLNSDVDLKNTDADGNGYLDHEDFIEMENHYAKVHNFVPNTIGDLSSVPVSFVPQSTDVDSGEWLFIDVYAGSSSVPALDIYGIAFSFNINPDIIDSSTVAFNLADDTWLGYNSPLYNFTIVPVDGKVDIAVSRINNQSADGIGLIGTLEFIVEDEVEGLKTFQQSDYADQQIVMNNIISVNEFGNYKRHADQNQKIRVATELKDKSEIEDIGSQIQLYPNPAHNYINIESDKYSIDKIELIDALGRVHMTQFSGSYFSRMNVSSLPEGVYFVRISSHQQTITKLLQKFDL